MTCSQCGYDYESLARPQLTQALGEETAGVLTEFFSVGELHARPDPEVWSALEYACHVRDVLEVQRHRVKLAQSEDVPAFAPMGRDERVASLSYATQDPDCVAADLAANAHSLMETLEDLSTDGWRRTGIYNYPVPAERSVEWIIRNTIHELVHHRQDIRSVGAGRRP